MSENNNKIVKYIKNIKKVYLDSFALEMNLPIMEAQRILNKLAEKQNAEVTVDENGKLIYLFKDDLETSEKFIKVLFDILKGLLRGGKDIFVAVSKILMLLVFTGYSFIYFIFLIFGFIFSTALFSFGETLADENRNIDGDYKSGASSVTGYDDYFTDFFRMMNYAFTLKSFHDEGYNINANRPFYAKVFSFVFGDDFEVKTIDNEVNILKFIKKYHKITLSDIINLTGLPELKSQKLILSVIVKYNGEISVSENGVIYYKFNDFDFRGLKKGSFSYIWERKQPEHKLNINDEDTNTKIIIFGIVNLTISAIVTLGAFDGNEIFSPGIYNYLKFWYGNLSFFYSSVFFILPVIRYPFVLMKRNSAKKINYIYYLLNDFSYNINRDYIDMDETDDDAEVYLFENYPNIFIHDFIDDKNVINLTRYHEEIKFTSDNNPKNIKIFDPDDVDFLESFEDF